MMKYRQPLGGWPYLQRNDVSGTVTSRKAKLHLSSAVSQCRSALTCDGKRSSPSMAAACLQRSNPAQWGFPRQAAAGNHSKDNSKASLGTVVGKIVTALADKLDEVRDAVSSNSGCAVVLVRRGISVSVPRGRRVSEKIWRELEAGCKVSVSSHVVTTMVPSKEQCYPTPAYWAACFHTAKDLKMARKLTSGEGGGYADWLELLEDTRRTAEEGRKRHHDQLMLNKAKDEAAGQAPDEQQRDGATEVAGRVHHCLVVVVRGGSPGVGAADCAAAGETPVLFFDGSHRRRRLCPSPDARTVRVGRLPSVVKALGRWFNRFRFTPRIAEGLWGGLAVRLGNCCTRRLTTYRLKCCATQSEVEA